ncbi:MAG: Ldh family oxidoreductase [Planctomycetota bacterium]|nr:Ldh family oxidoreductase [Planctomycetota bacterium]
MTSTIDYPRDPSQEVVIPVESLRETVTKLLVKKGMFAAEAKMGASRLIEADLRGIYSHGSRAVGRYIEAMDLGQIDPRAQMIVERETAAIAVMDGGMGLGQVAATKGMQLAIAKAKEVGTGTVVVKHSQHYGAASVYALMAIEAGMIGYTTTSTGPATVAALGSRKPAVANHCFAWGVPVQEGAPFVLDAACAASSWGKVEALGMYGLPIPDGWALDEAGEPTTTAKAAKTLLPFAGARGYGLGFVSSILAGPLAGGKSPMHKNRAVELEGSEHFFYAIDIQQFANMDKFHTEVADTMAAIRALEPADGFDRVSLPGELEWERSRRSLESGISLHKDHVTSLEALATRLNVEIAWK